MNLFELFVKIGVDDQASKNLENISKKLGNGLKTAAKIGTAAVTAATTGIIALTTAAVKSYSEYEQLVGGVDTLFKGASGTLQKYAANAYKTAGMSANDYMATATSFAASLLQSFGDTSGEITEEMAESMIASLDEQVDAFEEATEAQIELINRQYTENLKLIDEEEYRRIKAIDDEIAKLNEQEKAEEDAIKKRQQEQRKAELQFQIENASTAAKRREAEKQLAEYEQQIAEEQRKEDRKNQIEALKDQKDAVKEEADLKREALEEKYDYELETYKKARDNELKELKKSLEKQEKAIIASIGKTASSLSLPAKAYEEAAKATDMAISDMSDNANKMGTSMELIQNAYQGFAKGNYTMLDNLKLGYVGTKTEMERLISDASRLNSEVKKGDLSFGNIVLAIHTIQDQLGITGTTLSEAGLTIQGSYSAMKAAFENLLVGITDPTQDFGLLVDNFVDTVLVFSNNAVPVFKKGLDGILKLAEAILPKLAEELPGIVADILPIISQTALDVIEAFVKTIGDNGEKFMSTAVPMIENIVNGILNLLPLIAKVSLDLVLALANGLVQNNTLSELIPAVFKVISEIVKIFFEPENMKKINKIASDLLVELADGIAEAIPTLVGVITSIINGIVTFLLTPQNIATLTNSALKIVIALGTGLISAIPQLLLSTGNLITSIVDAFMNTDWKEVGKSIIDGLGKGLSGAFKYLKDWISYAWDSLWGKDVEPPDWSDYSPNTTKGKYGTTFQTSQNTKTSGVNIVQNIYSQKQTAADLMEEAVRKQNKAVFMGSGVLMA